MKKVLIFILTIALMFILSACGCDHEWTNATCLSPKTCNLCGKTKGNTTDHNYMDANCDHPKRCSFCDYTVGKALYSYNYKFIKLIVYIVIKL